MPFRALIISVFTVSLKYYSTMIEKELNVSKGKTFAKGSGENCEGEKNKSFMLVRIDPIVGDKVNVTTYGDPVSPYFFILNEDDVNSS